MRLKQAGDGSWQGGRRSGNRNAQQRFEAGGVEEMKKYLIVVEQTQTGYSAYSPDLPGCVSTGHTNKICVRLSLSTWMGCAKTGKPSLNQTLILPM
jgi:hypothetical protein